MKFKTSFINTGILLNDLRRYSMVGLVYLLGLLASIPLQLFMLYSRDVDTTFSYWNYTRVLDPSSSAFLGILTLIIPVLTGLLLFRYLQTNKATDMEHSLPVKRNTLYTTRVVAGIILLCTPIIITALTTWGVVNGLGLEAISNNHIFTWMSVSLLFNLILFMTSVAIGMVTGMSWIQGILTYIVLFLPSGLSMLVLYNLEIYVYGLATSAYSRGIEGLSPLVRLMEQHRTPIELNEVIIYLILIVALFFIGKYLYQKRHLESAGNAITFDILRPIFKYGVTFSFMLVLGAYFYGVQGGLAWTYFGYVIGALIGYFLAEILLNRSIYVFKWKNIKGFGIYSLIIILLIGLLNTNIIGYETRQPDLAEVESIYLNNSFYQLYQSDRVVPKHIIDYDMHRAVPIYTKQENIENIHALHEAIIDNIDEEKEELDSINRYERRKHVALVYNLKNGNKMYRHYHISYVKYGELLKPIYESREYKEFNYEILKLDSNRVNSINFNAIHTNKNLQISDQQLIKETISVIQKDIYELTFEEMMRGNSRKPAWATGSIFFNNDEHRTSITFEKSYNNFEQWLKDNGKLEQVRIMPNEIDRIIVTGIKDQQVDDLMHWERRARLTDRHYIEQLLEKPDTIIVDEKDKIEICLRAFYERTDQPQKEVILQLKNGDNFGGYLIEDEIPEFLR
ncbi:hypothetical protein SYNTR_1354 [Candidatus Syntrophocurvum alkaliphilum]|uniref:DUF6449 domain-containing protein n=1 Tax=Candidatus Syntrophocurvum alkaliphilum TaxID=2293317 RepID=A0A6I6DFW9_9FIRM|nr:DUF6449 domain-containing protein [Candidatus Syntrophocurvum alkaliphilum]QGT99947.1 hypothetical protein SYNTR_1354 [Candidatus Syntrophocurvum alkaliphilum]